ncbi:MAG: hypothetical protein ACOH5I_11130 [Oligoflexus sp.]
MDFVPEIIDGAVILNGVDICSTGPECRPCTELAVGVHNWLISHEINYLIVDFQDEKEVCSTVLTELLQLRKRLRFPFLFCGMMENPRKFLKSYAYQEHPFFSVPEEAVSYLKEVSPASIMADLSQIKVGEPIPCTRSRSYKSEDAEPDLDEPEAEAEAEI